VAVLVRVFTADLPIELANTQACKLDWWDWGRGPRRSTVPTGLGSRL